MASRKYGPLARHLEKDGRDRIELTFSQIEQIIGAPLPDSARNYDAWWIWDSETHTQAVWLDVGYQVQLHREHEFVVFFRS